MTIIAAAIILSFTTIEFFDYRRVNVDTSIVVDRSRGEKLTVNMNITFPRVPCYREYLRPFDSVGEHSVLHARTDLSRNALARPLPRTFPVNLEEGEFRR